MYDFGMLKEGREVELLNVWFWDVERRKGGRALAVWFWNEMGSIIGT
jgi:hypothetical protein